MSDVTLTPRRLAWQRRRKSAGRTWSQFRRHRTGMIGLGILVFFGLVALLAPVLAPHSMIEVTEATGGVLQPPSWEFPLGTDENGRSVLALLIWGARISLLVGLLATAISMFLGTLIGLASGHYRNSWSCRSCRWRSSWPACSAGPCSTSPSSSASPAGPRRHC